VDNVIKKIELAIDSKKIVLTPKQCKKLMLALDELFGEEVVHHYHDSYWRWRWNQPYWLYGTASSGQPCDNDAVTYSASNSTMAIAV